MPAAELYSLGYEQVTCIVEHQDDSLPCDLPLERSEERLPEKPRTRLRLRPDAHPSDPAGRRHPDGRASPPDHRREPRRSVGPNRRTAPRPEGHNELR